MMDSIYPSFWNTVKFLKIQTPEKFAVMISNHPNIWTRWLNRRVMQSKDSVGTANSVDPDQTAPLGAVWSETAMFAQTYLSENLGLLR